MRRTGFGICIFMIISVLAGLALPKLTFLYQDQKSSEQAEEYEAQNAGLPFEDEVIDSLRMMYPGYKKVDITGGTIRTETEIREIARELLERWRDEYNIVLIDEIGDTGSYEVSYSLAISAEVNSEEELYTAIIWEVTVWGPGDGSHVDFWFDDASGKMVSFVWYFPTSGGHVEKSDAAEYMYMLLENGLEGFFYDYYELDGVISNLRGEYMLDYGGYGFIFKEGKYGETWIPAQLPGNAFYFNPALGDKNVYIPGLDE